MKTAKLTKYKQAIADIIRESLPEIPQIYDSLDEISPDMIPCLVLSFDKGVRYEQLADKTYEATARLSIDIFLPLESIQISDALSERLLQILLKNIDSITIQEVSAQNLPGERHTRVIMHDFEMKFIYGD